MAAKKTKNHYYVLVFTNDGPVYVTGVGDHHTAFWNKNDKPYELSKYFAEDMRNGLTWNGYSCVLVSSPFEITSHPYNYEEYHMTWEKNEVNTTKE